MKLITIAHKGEAQEFIRRKHNIPVDFYFTGLFRHEDEILLLTGSGIKSVTSRIKKVIEYFGTRVTYVLNFGIAGTLNKNLQLNQIYGIRRIYYEQNNPIPGQYIVTANIRGMLDCITASNPVTDDEYANRLAPHADIVDLESWGIASVCQGFSLPLKSYKLISDRAGEMTNASIIKQNAYIYSRHLFDFYKKLPE